jgi:hypothetical protein
MSKAASVGDLTHSPVPGSFFANRSQTKAAVSFDGSENRIRHWSFVIGSCVRGGFVIGPLQFR